MNYSEATLSEFRAETTRKGEKGQEILRKITAEFKELQGFVVHQLNSTRTRIRLMPQEGARKTDIWIQVYQTLIERADIKNIRVFERSPCGKNNACQEITRRGMKNAKPSRILKIEAVII